VFSKLPEMGVFYFMDGEKNMNEESRIRASEKAQEIIDKAVGMSTETGKRVIAAPVGNQIKFIFEPSNKTARNLAKEAGLPPSEVRKKPNVVHAANIAPGVKAELVETPSGLEPKVNGRSVPFGTKISDLRKDSGK